MEKAPTTTARKENPTTRPPSDDSSKRPVDLTAKPPVLAQVTFLVLDIHSEWHSSSVQEPPPVEDPKEVAFLKELVEKFGSKEEARRIFGLYSAMHQGKSVGAAATVPQLLTIPNDTTAKTSIPHSEKAQAPIEESTQDQPHAETRPSPIMEEQEGIGGLEVEQEGISGFVEELDGMTVDDFGNEAEREGKISREKSVEGETPRNAKG